MNRVILIGRLVRDPEMRTVGARHTMARFALVVDRAWQT
ncbi:MAG: single-stranded DNA-binding protein [Armatimonadota bacterium]